MLETYRASLEHWGWRWKLCGPHAESVLLTHFGSVLNNSMNAVDMQVCVVLLCFMVFAAWVCYSDSCSLLPAVFLFLSAELCCCLICLPTRVLCMWFCAKALSECAAVLTLDPDQTAHVNVQSCYYLCALLCRFTCINWQRLRVWPCCLLLSFVLSMPRRAAALSCLGTRYSLQSVPNWFHC